MLAERAREETFPARMPVKRSHTPDAPDTSFRVKYRPDIDGLRALAIIPVIFFHAFPTIMPGGFVGVDIFFVISGFLISNIILQALQRGDFSFRGFYANRIRRIFPALLVVLLTCFVVGWFFLLPDEYAQLGKHIVGAAAYVENFVLRREAGYFDVRSSLKPLMHIWSLGIEEQFYLTYPLFLWLVWRVRQNLFDVLLSLAFLSFGLNIWQVHCDVVAAFFFPQTRGWELMVGGAIACWYLSGRQFRSTSVRNACSVAGTLLIVLAIFLIHERDLFPGWWAVLPVSGASLLILGGPGAWINRRILSHKWMVFVGLISYPLYLWHWPVLTFPRILRGAELPAVARLAGLLVSFGLAAATWRFIENPIRFGRKTWIKTAALLSTSAAIGCLGYAAYRDGFIGRFPNAVADIGRLREVRWAIQECRSAVGMPDIDYCRASSGSTPDVLLIGDSHAAVLYDGLAPEYEKRSEKVMNLGQSGCVPLYDTDSFSRGSSHKDCRPVVNHMLDFSISAASVHTIIVSSRGPKYMSGEGFGSVEEGTPSKELLFGHARAATPQEEMFAESLRNTVSRLYASKKDIVLFLDWPELGFDPRTCLLRPVRLFSNPRAICGVPRVEVEARNQAYRGLVFELKKEFPKIRVFDPLPYLCDRSTCYGMKDGHLLYSDDNHLSITGASYLSRKLVEEEYPARIEPQP